MVLKQPKMQRNQALLTTTKPLFSTATINPYRIKSKAIPELRPLKLKKIWGCNNMSWNKNNRFTVCWMTLRSSQGSIRNRSKTSVRLKVAKVLPSFNKKKIIFTKANSKVKQCKNSAISSTDSTIYSREPYLMNKRKRRILLQNMPN